MNTTELTQAWEDGHRAGYRAGDMERIALANANSDLRSEVLRLQQVLRGERADAD